MKKMVLALVMLMCLCLGLAAPALAAEAAAGGEQPGIGEQVAIGELVKRNALTPQGVVGYDPAKLEIGQRIYLYNYFAADGFIQAAEYYPLLFDGQLVFMVEIGEGELWFDSRIAGWLREAGVSVDKPLALARDRDSYYVYDGEWRLLDKLGAGKRHELAQLDLAAVNPAGLELKAMNGELTLLADAYLGRLSLEQQAEAAAYQEEQAALRQAIAEKDKAARQEQAAAAEKAWLQELRARGYVPIYRDGELWPLVCQTRGGRAMIPLGQLVEITGSSDAWYERLSYYGPNEWVWFDEIDWNTCLNRLTGDVKQNGGVIGQVLVQKQGDVEWIELRGLLELFDFDVYWDDTNKQIIVTSR